MNILYELNLNFFWLNGPVLLRGLHEEIPTLERLSISCFHKITVCDLENSSDQMAHFQEL